MDATLSPARRQRCRPRVYNTDQARGAVVWLTPKPTSAVPVTCIRREQIALGERITSLVPHASFRFHNRSCRTMIAIRSTMSRYAARTILGLAVLTLASIFGSAPAQAGSVTYTLNTAFNGGTPTSTPPWLTATFADNGADTVRLTLTASLNVATEFISDVAFNVLDTIVPSSLTFTPVSGVPSTVQATTQNAQNLTGGGSAGQGFDVNLAFTTANNSNRFEGSDVVIYDIKLPGLTFADFEFTNTGSAHAHVGAHVQGIPGTTGPSSAIKDGAAVPEPSSVILSAVGLGLVSLVSVARRKRS